MLQIKFGKMQWGKLLWKFREQFFPYENGIHFDQMWEVTLIIREQCTESIAPGIHRIDDLAEACFAFIERLEPDFHLDRGETW